jgi:hypothetical protein
MSFTDRILWGLLFLGTAVALLVWFPQGFGDEPAAARPAEIATAAAPAPVEAPPDRMAEGSAGRDGTDSNPVVARKIMGIRIISGVLAGIALLIFFKAWRKRRHLGSGPCDLCDRPARPLKAYRLGEGRHQSTLVVCWICETQKYLFLLLFVALLIGAAIGIDALKVHFPSSGESVTSPDRYDTFMTIGFFVWLVGGIALYQLVRWALPAGILERRAAAETTPIGSESDLYDRLRELNAELLAWTYADGRAKLDCLNHEARQIGEILNKQGGKARMLEVHQALGLGRPIESAWDGIGQWRG